MKNELGSSRRSHRRDQLAHLLEEPDLVALVRALDDRAAFLRPQVNLVFYDDITERELRSLVLAVGAEVVEGPTPQGMYTLAFSRQMSPGEIMDALRQLRFSRRVLFAEPAMTTKVGGALDW